MEAHLASHVSLSIPVRSKPISQVSSVGSQASVSINVSVSSVEATGCLYRHASPKLWDFPPAYYVTVSAFDAISQLAISPGVLI